MYAGQDKKSRTLKERSRKECDLKKSRSSSGALRGNPAEGVAGDSVAAQAQGKAFPKLQIPTNVLEMFYLGLRTGYDIPMSNLSNRPDHFETIRVSHQAREILNILNHERSTNSQILSKWLGSIGLGISQRDLQDLLDRLEKEELVRTEKIDNFRVIHLRQLGGEVAMGIETLDWIAKPELSD